MMISTPMNAFGGTSTRAYGEALLEGINFDSKKTKNQPIVSLNNSVNININFDICDDTSKETMDHFFNNLVDMLSKMK